MTDYRDYQRSNAPRWLYDKLSQALLEAVGHFKDAFVYLAKDAVKSRYADTGPLDALPEIAKVRGLSFGAESDGNTFRSRLRRAFHTWSWAGKKIGLLEELLALGVAAVDVRESAQDSSLRWYETEIWLFAPFAWNDQYLADGRWGDPGVWGDLGYDALHAPIEVARRIRAIIRKFKPTHLQIRSIVFVHSGEAWDETAPPGTWDDFAEPWGSENSFLSL